MTSREARCKDCGSTSVRWIQTATGKWCLMNTTGTQYVSGEWTRGTHYQTCSKLSTRSREEQMSAIWPSLPMAGGRTAWNVGGQLVTIEDGKVVAVDVDQMVDDLAAERLAQRSAARAPRD